MKGFDMFFLLCSQLLGISPDHCSWEEQAAVDSTTTLLHSHDTQDTLRAEGSSKTTTTTH